MKVTLWEISHEAWAVNPDGVRIGWDERDIAARPAKAVAFLRDRLGASDDDILRIRAALDSENFATFGKYWLSTFDIPEREVPLWEPAV